MAGIGIADFLKKRLGSSASRDPRVTWSGTFGTESSRKKQANRLAEQPSKAKPAVRSETPSTKATKSDYMSQVSSAALKKFQDKELPEMRVTAEKRPVPKVAPKSTTKPTAKPKAPAPKVDRMKDFMGSLSEDNAVLEKLRKRGFKKGGSIDGCITKGGTKGRYI